MQPSLSLPSFFRPLVLTLVVGASIGVFLLSVQPARATSWYSTSWGYREAITINNTKVSQVSSTVLSNFPVLISFTDPSFRYTGDGGDVASSTGADIIFTASDGVTPLNYEIENYSSSTGNLIAWVKVPALSSSASDTIYIYLGNASATTPTASTTQNTWNNGFIGVYHLASNGTTLNTNDSTGVYNGTNDGATATTTGKIFGGASFNGSSTYIYNNSFADPQSSITFSAWANLGNNSNYNTIFDIAYGYAFFAITDANDVMYIPAGCLIGNGGTAVGQDHLYTGVYNSATEFWALYEDGSLLGNCPASSTSSFAGQNTLTIGAQFKGQGGQFFQGIIDEARISSVARSVDWISTEYNNQSSPSTFYSTSTLQAYVPVPIINSFIASPAYIASPGATSTLSWNATGTITSITITSTTLSTTTPVGSITVNPATSTTYTLSVANANGTSTLTTAVTIDTTPPSVPTDLTEVTSTPSSIALQWSASTDSQSGLAGYDIYRNGVWIASTTPTTYIDTAVNSPSYAYYDDTGLSASTTYTYAVDALDNVGNVSSQSSSTQATTAQQIIPSSPQWSIGWYTPYGDTPAISNIYWSGLTDIAQQGAIPQANGTLDLATNDVSSTASALIPAAHTHNVKVLISISEGDANMASATANNMTALVNNIMNVVNTYGYDGVDIDWEGSINWTNMGTLLSDLRTQLGTKLLTADAPVIDYPDWGTAVQYLDRLNIMNYDMSNGITDPYLWTDSALYAPNDDVYSWELNLTRFTANGVPASKINMGMPFFGFVIQGGCQTSGCTSGLYAPLQTWTTAPTWTQFYNYQLNTEYNLTPTNPDWHWDITAHKPYLSIDLPTAASDTMVTFENAQSVMDKMNFVQANGLGGSFFYNLGQDYDASGTDPAQQYPLSYAMSLAYASGTVTTPPSIAITAPTSTTVSGIATISASSTAVSPASISSIQFYLDGSPLGSPVTSTSSPNTYSYSWDTTGASNASHTLYALATDNYGNTASSSPITLTVYNTPATPPPPTGVPQSDFVIVPTASTTVSSTISTSTAIIATSTVSSIASSSAASSSPSLSSSSLQAELNMLLAELQALEAQAGSGSSFTPPSSPPSYAFTGNLQLWDQGPEVTALQSYLMAEDTGPAAGKLKNHGTTEVFGLLTYNALVEFQASVGIHATGYLGPITRAYVNGHK